MSDLKDATLDQYVLCEECSKAEGTKVYFHKARGVRKIEGFLSSPRYVCPHGHTVTLDGAR